MESKQGKFVLLLAPEKGRKNIAYKSTGIGP